MTTVQWIGVISLAVGVFGSFAVGRYLRWLDEKPQKIVIHPIRPITSNDVGGGKSGYIYTSTDEDKLREYMNAYYEELDRIVRGYHSMALLEGEGAAEAWYAEQKGQTVS